MSSESTSPTASPSTETPDSSPPPPSSTSPPPPSTTSPPPPSTTSPPPPSKTPPPPSTPAATPPPSDPSSSPPPPNSPPPAPPTSSPPPPSSTPPPATPDTSESPPPPASTSPPSPPAATPSPPAPVDAAPTLPNSPPTTPAFSPPQAQEKPVPASETPRPPSQLSHNPTRSGAGSRSSESSSSSGDQPSIDGGVIAGIVVGGVVIIALLMVIICLMCRNKKKRKPQYYMDPGRQPNGTNQYYNQDPAQWHSAPAPGPPNQGGNGGGGWGSTHMQGHANTSGEFSSHPMPPSTNMGGIHQFSYEELASATGGFCEANLLGQGGFGLVHKGILPDRREVAVKSLKSGSGQGEREFQAEVEIISRVHHRHLVSLVGYCIAGDNKLLVYEFVANKTMEFHLHGKGQPVLDWPTRLRIAIGSAKGLAYLHEDCLPRIIHRDIKAANILIDNNYEAMVADFGLAKLTTDNNTHISTRVMGTFGYLAPEYASSGKLSEKSDVFSFGVMLLELVTGRRPIDLTNITMEDSLVDWARPLLAKALEDGNYEQLVDPGLEGKYLPQELARMAACAAASIRHSARKRPKMSQIVRALEGDSSLEDLNEGVKPGQSAMYNPNGSGTTEVYDTRAYNADMMQFKKMVMPTQEFNSGESGSTSEYGLINPSHSTDADSTEMERKPFDVNKS